jgi:hypothetical protein
MEGLLAMFRMGNDSESQNSAFGNITGTKVGSPGYGNGKFGGALTGTSSAGWQYTSTDLWSTNSAGAVEWWWIPASLASGAGLHLMLFGGNGHPQLNLGQINGTTWRWLFNIEGGSTYMNVSESVGGFATDGVPVHIAFCWDENGIDGGSDTSRAYVDGEVQQSSTTAYTSQNWNNSSEDRFGIDAGASAPLNGTGDNLKFWNFAKTDYSDRFIEFFGGQKIRIT